MPSTESSANRDPVGHSASSVNLIEPRTRNCNRCVPLCGRLHNGTAMFRCGALLALLIVATGCEVIWTVPPARGHVVDLHSRQPVPGASVTRIRMSGVTNQTVTDANGNFKFRGKRSVQVFPFGDALAWATYRIEAAGYETVETNRPGFGSMNGLRHYFEEIELPPNVEAGDTNRGWKRNLVLDPESLMEGANGETREAIGHLEK